MTLTTNIQVKLHLCICIVLHVRGVFHGCVIRTGYIIEGRTPCFVGFQWLMKPKQLDFNKGFFTTPFGCTISRLLLKSHNCETYMCCRCTHVLFRHELNLETLLNLGDMGF